MTHFSRKAHFQCPRSQRRLLLCIALGIAALFWLGPWAGDSAQKYYISCSPGSEYLLAPAVRLLGVAACILSVGLLMLWLALHTPVRRSWNRKPIGSPIWSLIGALAMSSALVEFSSTTRLPSPLTDVVKFEMASEAFLIVVAHPILEELLWRGCVFAILLPLTGTAASAIIMSVGFIAFHGRLDDIAFLCALAAWLYYAESRHGLRRAILMHAVVNLGALGHVYMKSFGSAAYLMSKPLFSLLMMMILLGSTILMVREEQRGCVR